MKKRYSKDMLETYDVIRLAIPFYDTFQSKVAEFIKNFFGKASPIRIIDLGCGTGLTSIGVLEQMPYAEITLVDYDPIVIEQAKKRLKNYEKRTLFILEDGLKYLKKLPDNSCEAVISALMLHNLKSTLRLKYLEEIYRILIKGGVFVNADKYASDDEEKHKRDLEFHLNCFEVFKRKISEEVAENWRKHFMEDMEQDKIMFSKRSVVQLKKIGFSSVKEYYRNHMFAVLVAEK